MKIQSEKISIQAGGDLELGAAATITAGSGYILLPQFTTSNRPKASAALKGLLIYNTTTNKLNFCTGTDWEAVTSA